MQKVVVFMSELHGGLLKFGWICSPNSTYAVAHLTLFIDNLFAYGTGYVDFESIYVKMVHRK